MRLITFLFTLAVVFAVGLISVGDKADRRDVQAQVSARMPLAQLRNSPFLDGCVVHGSSCSPPPDVVRACWEQHAARSLELSEQAERTPANDSWRYLIAIDSLRAERSAVLSEHYHDHLHVIHCPEFTQENAKYSMPYEFGDVVLGHEGWALTLALTAEEIWELARYGTQIDEVRSEARISGIDLDQPSGSDDVFAGPSD